VRYVLVLEPEQSAGWAPMSERPRLARLLKQVRRSYGFRVVSCQPAGGTEVVFRCGEDDPSNPQPFEPLE